MKRYLKYVFATVLMFTEPFYGQETKTTVVDSFSLAETYLNNIGAKKEKQRKIFGSIALGLGLISVTSGLALVSGNDDDDFLQLDKGIGAFLILEGVTFSIIGVRKLSTLSSAEKKRREVETISEIEQRDNIARQALSDLAKSARTRRSINSILFGGLAVFSLTQDDEESELFAALFACGAIYSLVRQSMEEKQLKRYLEVTESEISSIKFGLGFTTTCGVLITTQIVF